MAIIGGIACFVLGAGCYILAIISDACNQGPYGDKSGSGCLAGVAACAVLAGAGLIFAGLGSAL